MMTLLSNQQITLIVVLILFVLSIAIWVITMTSVIRKEHTQLLEQLFRVQTAMFSCKSSTEAIVSRFSNLQNVQEFQLECWKHGSEQPLNAEQLILLYEELTRVLSSIDDSLLKSEVEETILFYNYQEHLQANIRMFQALAVKFNAKLVRFPSILIANALDIEPFLTFPK